jgi:hypothetical protein
MTDKERAWSLLSCICPEGWSDSDAEVVTLSIREAVAAEREAGRHLLRERSALALGTSRWSRH